MAYPRHQSCGLVERSVVICITFEVVITGYINLDRVATRHVGKFSGTGAFSAFAGCSGRGAGLRGVADESRVKLLATKELLSAASGCSARWRVCAQMHRLVAVPGFGCATGGAVLGVIPAGSVPRAGQKTRWHPRKFIPIGLEKCTSVNTT